jgi:hypothetical protein
MPPRASSPDMPLPDLSEYDTSTFKGRLYGAGAEPAEIEDLRDQDPDKPRSAKGDKLAVAQPPDKMSKDAGIDDIGKPKTKKAAAPQPESKSAKRRKALYGDD